MTTKNGIIILVVIAAIAAIAIFAYSYLTQEKPPVGQIPGKIQEIIPPPATGNIDDVVNSLLKELADEKPLFTEEEGDVALISTDNQEIGDFGQSINESEL